MISPYSLLQETGFAQYTAMVRFTYDRENTSLGAEKLAEMVRAIPGSTRVSTVSLDKDRGIAIFSVKLISAKTPKAAFVSFKENALKKFKGMLLSVEVGAGTIETKGNFILNEEKKAKPQSNLSNYLGQLLEEGLITEVSVEQLKAQYVDCENQKISPEDFQKIVEACTTDDGKVQSNYATWLCSRIAAGICTMDAVEVWGERFRFFDTYKSRFKTKDLNQLKTKDQIQDWVDNELIPIERSVFQKQIAGGSKVEDRMQSRLEELRVKDFRSKVTGKEWYVFKLTKAEDFDVEHYLGSGTQWCTRDNKATYLRYLNERDIEGLDGAYWIFVNKSNPKEKWQLLVKAGYMCNTADKNFLRARAVVPVEMMKHLQDKEGQTFPYYIQENIQWLDQLLAAKDEDEEDSTPVNLEAYHINTRSSYKAYKIPSNEKEAGKLLTQLKLVKSPIQAQVTFETFDRQPIAVIYNEGAKNAEPIYVAKGYYNYSSNYLVDASNNSGYFENIKNVNEAKLLEDITRTFENTTISNEVREAWLLEDLPDLSSFRYNGRDDVWQVPSNELNNFRRAWSQLNLIARKIATGGVRNYSLEDLSRIVGQSTLTTITFIRLGHNLGFLTQRDGDIDFNPITYISGGFTDQIVLYYAVYEKLQKVGIPIHFAESDRPVFRRSEMYRAVWSMEHSSLEHIDSFKTDSRNSEANSRWNFYNIPANEAKCVFNAYSPFVLVSTDDPNVRLGFSGRSGYTTIVRPQVLEGDFIKWEVGDYVNVAEVLGLLGLRNRGNSDFGTEFNAFVDALRGFEINLMSNRKWNRYSQFVRAGVSNQQGVPSYYIAHRDEMQPVNVPWSRRGVAEGEKGVKMSWDEARPLLEVSSPQRVSWVNRVAPENPNVQNPRVLDVTFYWINETPGDWQCVIRVIDDNNQIAVAFIRTGTGSGLSWRYARIPERQRITVDENGNAVQTQPTRQPRQPRQAAAPAPETNVNLEQVQDFAIETNNASQAYSTNAEHCVELLEAFGFTTLVNQFRNTPVESLGNVTIYRACPHRGNTQWIVLLWNPQQNTIVIGNPESSINDGYNCSRNWRRLTTQIDNSVATFQQCQNICAELHIPTPIAIQEWVAWRSR